MKFRYIFGIILIGAMSLIGLVIYHWHELPRRFGGGALPDAPDHVLSAPTNQEDMGSDMPVQTFTTADGPLDLAVEQSPEVKVLVRFVDTNFDMAANLNGERLEIWKRKGLNGQYSLQDQKRLQEIHIAIYSYLKEIDEKIDGSTQPYLSRRSGKIRCGFHLMPHKLKERLGVVPEGYYRFEKSVMPFLTNPKRLTTK